MGDLLGRLGFDPASSRQLSVARDTVARALASDGPPKYERAAGPSAITEVEPWIRALLSVYPRMPATVLAERVGWTGSISWFRSGSGRFARSICLLIRSIASSIRRVG